MKRLFFSVLALTIGAFAFVSCEKEDNPSKEKNERGSYLSMQDQQALYSEAFIKSGEQVQFEDLAQSVKDIIYSFAGKPLVVDSAYAQMREDREAARKMAELKKVDNVSDLNLDALYFGVDLILNETIIDGDTMMVAQVQKINHNVDRFIINITSKGHTLNSSLKVSAAETGSVEVYTATPEGGTDVETVILPSLVSFAVNMDGKSLIGADLKIATDYLIKIINNIDADEDTKLESVTLDGSKLDMNAVFTVADCSFGGNLSYTEKAGINLGAVVKANGFEVFGADINVKAVLSNNTNYANSSNLMGLAMSGINGLSANARLGSEAIVFKAEFKKNPVTAFFPILSAMPEEMPAAVDSLNKIFSCGAYFKGYKEPQAKFVFSYNPVDESDIIQSEDEDDMFTMLVAAIVNSGLTMVVETYDAEGKEITVSAKEYFGKIDVSQFAQGMTDKFNAAFAETLAPLFHVSAEDFDLTEILKLLIFNHIIEPQGGDIITEG